MLYKISWTFTSVTVRVSTGLVALWEFDEASGATVTDTSRVGPALDLTIQDVANVSRNAGSLTINSATTIISADAATKIHTACTATNAFSVEVWAAPANTTQAGPARMATYSSGISGRNFSFMQETSSVAARVRSTSADFNGGPTSFTGADTLDTALQHFVLTRDSGGTRTVYIDGVDTAVSNASVAGDFSGWDSSYKFVIGNETSNDRPWLGTFHLVAVCDRALSAAEVTQNYGAGAD